MFPLALSYSEANMTVTVYGYLLKSFSIYFKNEDEYQTTYNQELNESGKICATDSYMNFLTDCKDAYEGYNSNWVSKKIKQDCDYR